MACPPLEGEGRYHLLFSRKVIMTHSLFRMNPELEKLCLSVKTDFDPKQSWTESRRLNPCNCIYRDWARTHDWVVCCDWSEPWLTMCAATVNICCDWKCTTTGKVFATEVAWPELHTIPNLSEVPKTNNSHSRQPDSLQTIFSRKFCQESRGNQPFMATKHWNTAWRW